MPRAAALRWYFQGMGLNALLPGAVLGGDVYRALALRQSGQPFPAHGAPWGDEESRPDFQDQPRTGGGIGEVRERGNGHRRRA